MGLGLVRPGTSCVTSLATIGRRAVSIQSLGTKNAAINALIHVSEIPFINNRSGPLQDVTVAVKDNICTTSMPTTCSSAMLLSNKNLGHIPMRWCGNSSSALPDFTSPFDATVVKRLQTSGAHIVGKTNCDEFGMG